MFSEQPNAGGQLAIEEAGGFGRSHFSPLLWEKVLAANAFPMLAQGKVVNTSASTLYQCWEKTWQLLDPNAKS